MFQAIRKKIDSIVPPISALLFLVGVASTVWGALIRTSGVQISVVWVEEVTRYTLIWAALLLMGIGFRKKTQTQFTLLEDHLMGNKKAVLTLIILVLELVMFGILIIGGFKLAITNRGQCSAVLIISMMWPNLAIPVSATLVETELIMLLAETLHTLFGKDKKSDNKNEPEVQ
jgi:TRAP-type C4-dicarboxylate transport system permease small subunit